MTPQQANNASIPAQPFAGTYDGKFTRLIEGETESFKIVVALQRNGERIHGRYNFGLGDGTIDGILIGSDLQLDWAWGGAVGKGVLSASSDGRGFSGTWGYAQARTGGGSWDGRLR